MFAVCSFNFLMVDLIFFLYKTGESMLDATIRPYIVRTVCREVFPANETTCINLDSYPVLEDYVQSVSASYLIYYRILVNIPAVILGLLCGTYSDRYGRKIPIMLPSLGSVFAVLLYMCSLVTPDARMVLILAGAGIQGMFGKSSVITMGVNSIITDMSDREERTQRLGKLLAMNFFGLFAGSLLSGLFQDLLDVNATFVFVVLLHASTVLCTVIFLRETIEHPNKKVDFEHDRKKSECLAMFNPANIKDALYVLCKPRKGNARIVIILLFLVSLANQTCKVGEMDITLLFVTRSPFNWPKSWYGYLLSLDYAVMGICLFIFLPFLTSVCKFSDGGIILVGISCKIVRLVWAGVSGQTWMVFVSVIIGAFAGMITSAIRSLLSKAVNEDEAGKIFSLLACAETASKLIGVLIFINLYSATAFFYPGLSYLIVGALYLIMFSLIGIFFKEFKEIGSEDLTMLFKEQQTYGSSKKTVFGETKNGRLPIVDELNENDPGYAAPLPAGTP
ncbi:hypothetical protein FSP39_010770 [Pinctada imbricata]|uniref:Proton-coupled folate transporter-like protein n=1 Tax=Pinctada imbricata TaxID=66713 RepID=A0AA89BJ68_PINIB|nr:hypothetical protein FSP39_008768 [Pinctada imbricata]KAK3084261.1 hypothetical protein FSP39_010770 [Pinctada imbricata]